MPGDFIAAHFPGVQVMQPQGTYMLFLDCAAWLQEHHMTLRELEERGARAGVIWQDGAAFAWAGLHPDESGPAAQQAR